MHFPRHWRIAKRGDVSAWGWSDESPAHAEARAAERLTKVLDRLARDPKTPAQRYGYPDRPMREEVLREFRSTDGALDAAVTRNSYGCLVLNTARMMFVDVDAPEAKQSGFLAGLFGFRKPKARRPEEFTEGVMARVEQWLARRPDWGWRVYRTRAGMRLLATHQFVPPEVAECHEAFEAFGADLLYRRLCANQKCFRARLSPKPWRCGVEKPRGRWPWANEKTKAKFRQWEANYFAAAKDYATCQFLGQFGQAVIHPALQHLVAFHDETTRVASGLPLA